MKADTSYGAVMTGNKAGDHLSGSQVPLSLAMKGMGASNRRLGWPYIPVVRTVYRYTSPRLVGLFLFVTACNALGLGTVTGFLPNSRTTRSPSASIALTESPVPSILVCVAFAVLWLWMFLLFINARIEVDELTLAVYNCWGRRIARGEFQRMRIVERQEYSPRLAMVMFETDEGPFTIYSWLGHFEEFVALVDIRIGNAEVTKQWDSL